MRKLTVLVMAAILTISAAGIPDETVTEEIPWCWDVPGYSECIDDALNNAYWYCADETNYYCMYQDDPWQCFGGWDNYYFYHCVMQTAGPMTVECQLQYCYEE